MVALTLGATAPALAQSGPRSAGAQWRDGAIDATAGVLYAAAYDRNEVWVVDLQSGERVARIPVGRGPADLALAGTTLAVANRLDKSVSIIDTQSRTVLRTVSLQDSPGAITAIGGNAFLVAIPFGDTAAVIDANTGSVTTPFTSVPAVPSFVAASRNTVAIAGKLRNSVSLYSASGGAPVSVVELEFTPSVLAPLGDGSILAGGVSGSAVVGQGGDVSATSVMPVEDAQPYGTGAAVLSRGQILLVSPSLEQQETVGSGNAQRLVSDGEWLAALAPAAGNWEVARAGSSAPAIASAPAPEAAPVQVADAEAAPGREETTVEEAEDVELGEPVSEPEEPMMEEEVEPAVEPAPAEAPVEEAPIAEAPAEEEESIFGGMIQPESTVAVDDAPVSEEVSTVEVAEEVAESGEIAGDTDDAGPIETPEEESDAGTGYGRHPVQVEGVRAPRPSSRPSALPYDRVSRETISDALIQPTEFGSLEAGFQPPDWNQPLRDIEADLMTRDMNAGRMDLKGNVHLRLGNMLFEADEFSYSEDLGDLRASGDVLLSQENSTLRAQAVTYEVPNPEDLPPPSILEPQLTPEQAQRKRLTLGRVMAEQVTLIEPTRELEAGAVDYDFLSGTGTFTEARGRAGMYFWGAKELRVLGPATAEGDEVWVTTCDHDPPHYRIRAKKAYIGDNNTISGTNARLELLGKKTPFFVPKWRDGGIGGQGWTLDFDSGRKAEVGYYLNAGQRFEINPDFAIGPRLYVTEKEGVGLGGDADYDFMDNPASRFYRTKGEIHGLYTTKDRGYAHWYHRWEPSDDLVVRMQFEHWGDEDFYKEFYYEEFRNRTSPRSFATVTYRQPTYIVEGVARASTHNFVRETERLPEGAFYLLDRPITDRLHISFDTVTGYNHREPNGDSGSRSANVARLTYDWDPLPALSITPFLEAETTWYSELRDEEASDLRFSTLAGVTAQTRFHREFGGRWGFSAFKHMVIPSVTYSYRPESNIDFDDTPRFDALDNVPGRSRIETKFSNILFGRDAETGDVWQVGRLTLYQGNDFWNEERKSADYEVELDVRPRQWWGVQLVGEKHTESDDFDLDEDDEFDERLFDLIEQNTGYRFDPDNEFAFNTLFGDYERALAQIYYDDTSIGGRLNGRLGFAYTATRSQVFNREILYGLGYKLNENWGVGFEHRYDLEDNDLRSQTYEIRRVLHCWEAALRFQDRESGFDVNVQFNITAFPGSRLKF